MIYRKFEDDNLSLLGLGCMRFPCLESGEVDMDKTAEIVDLCIKNGVNYFDTAWFYHDGKSENIIGEILSKYPRDSYFLADKMPWTDIETAEDAQNIFWKQLEKTGAEYFDYYLLHNVCEDNIHTFTDENINIINFLYEQKKNGKIRHLGFSTHGSLELMDNFIKTYRDKLEFCQIQLNWLDYTLQDAGKKVEMLNSYNMPIWVMEPVRGGRLASLSEEDEKTLKSMRKEESIAAWSFRYLQGIEGIGMILSGMSNMDQVMDNLKTFSCEKPLSKDETDTLYKIASKILDKKILTCTNCKYCVSECPKELDIPKLLRIYNDAYLMGNTGKLKDLEKETSPENCIGCGMCEKKCPQKIKISDIMKDFGTKLKG